MKTIKLWTCLACLCALVALAGCSQGAKEAGQVMTDYLNYIDQAQYDKAYDLLSDFDKGNISEDDFAKWQQQVAQIVDVESFSIDGKVDTFKNYKYLGTEFGTVYGLKVDRKQQMLIPGVELAGYDQDSFRIMVQSQQGGGKVLLLITQLDDTIAAYDAYLENLQ